MHSYIKYDINLKLPWGHEEMIKMQLDVEVSPPACWMDFNKHCIFYLSNKLGS